MDGLLNDDHSFDEATLLRLYADGDPRAAGRLADALLPPVLRYAQRMLSDAAEAEDVAQEAMMRLWRIAPEWRSGEARVSTWLYRVTTNLCLDRLRRKGPDSGLDEVDEPVDPGRSVLDHIQEKARVDSLQEALFDLPARQRQAVVLRHIEGLSNPEIGEIMDISARAVESLTARGKQALSQRLSRRRAELGFEDEGR